MVLTASRLLNDLDIDQLLLVCFTDLYSNWLAENGLESEALHGIAHPKFDSEDSNTTQRDFRSL